MDLSIVLPVHNEAGNLKMLFSEISETLSHLTDTYEIIFVDDGSQDGSSEIITNLSQLYSQIKYIVLAKKYGKSYALDAGLKLATGDIVITLDADGQDDPKEIPKFIEKIKEGYDLVSGWKQHRQDGFVKNKTSKFYNWVVNFIFNLNLHDHNCGFKAYKNEVVKNLSLHGELHRYIPVLVADMGYKINEIKVNHRQRFSGKTKFGSGRFIKGFLDLLTVLYLTTFNNRPLHLLGSVGIVSFLSGLVLCFYLTIIKFFEHQTIGRRPLLQLGVMLIIIGIQITLFGLLAEQITVIKNSQKPTYRIKTLKS